MHRRVVLVLPLLAALAGVTCAPHDELPGKKGSSLVETPIQDKAKPVDVPGTLQKRILAALKNIQERDLQADFGFWTVFHGILGTGLEASLYEPKTQKRIKAIDAICQGQPTIRGLKFIPTGNGVDVETVGGDGFAQGHQDQFIAEMAQWGLPADRKFRVNGQDFTFAGFHRHSKMRASIKGKQELSWAIVIISQYYLKSVADEEVPWTNDVGEKLNFLDVVRYETKESIDEAACGGTHRLFGLTWAYHQHLKRGGQTTAVWKDVADRIDLYKKNAREFRNPDGTFSTNYVSKKGNARDLTQRVGATGHVLEWLALAMSDDELKQQWMQDAADALVRMILENRSSPVDGGSLYHAAHGLHIYYNRLFGPLKNDPVIPLPPKG